MGEGQRHCDLILQSRVFFEGQGCAVAKSRVVIEDRTLYPDLIIRRGKTDIPFECGNIGNGKESIYLNNYGKYYHCCKTGDIYLVTIGGKSFIVNISGLPFEKIARKRVVIRKKMAALKCTYCGKSIRGRKFVIWQSTGQPIHEKCLLAYAQEV